MTRDRLPGTMSIMKSFLRRTLAVITVAGLLPSLAACSGPDTIPVSELTRAQLQESGESKDVHQVKDEVVTETGATCPDELETGGTIKSFACQKDGMNVQIGAYSDPDQMLDFLKESEADARDEGIKHSMVVGPDWYASAFDDDNNGEGGKNGESDTSRELVSQIAEATGGTIITFGS